MPAKPKGCDYKCKGFVLSWEGGFVAARQQWLLTKGVLFRIVVLWVQEDEQHKKQK